MIGQEIEDKLNELANISEPGAGVTRRYLTKEHEEANALIARWMKEAGLDVSIDAVGNVVGTYQCQNLDAKTLIIGSHQDTVIEGGKYDGALGIVLPLVVLKTCISNETLAYHVKLVSFGDEEGVRFGTTYFGSKAIVGEITQDMLARKDDLGIQLGEALQSFTRDETELQNCKLEGDAYFEVHIEQGPVLEMKNASVGVVLNIQASHRYVVHINGEAGHAGTVPMHARNDAGRRAAQSICELMDLVETYDDTVVTVGKIAFYPGAENVIPAKATYTIDIRSPKSERLNIIMNTFESKLKAFDCLEKIDEISATCCDASIIEKLKQSIVANNLNIETLNSGAGHDAQEMSAVMPVGMLFVRCAGGVSHHPSEAVAVSDLEKAAQVVHSFLTSEEI